MCADDTTNFDNSDLLNELMATLVVVVRMIQNDQPTLEDCVVISNHLNRLATIFVARKESLQKRLVFGRHLPEQFLYLYIRFR